jgi:hypothetical protein
LGQAQPKSAAYQAYKEIKFARKKRQLEEQSSQIDAVKLVQDALLFDEVSA